VRLAAAAALVALGAAAVAVAVLGPGGGGGASANGFEPNSIALVNARTGAPEGTAAPGLQICVFAVAGNDLWACDADQSILLRVDARSRRVVDQLPLPVFHGSFTIGFGSAWVGDAASPTVRRVSIRYRTSSPPIRLPGVPAHSPTGEPESVDSMTTAKGRVWAAYGFPKRIARIDPATNRVTFSAPLPQSCPCHAWLADDGDHLWAVGGDGVHVYRLDPRTGRTLATGRLHKGEVSGVAAAGGYLWVAVQEDDAVWKIDETGSVVGTVPVGHMPYDLAAGGGHLWVPNSDDGTVTRIDPATDKTRTYRVGHRPLAVAELKGTLFVGLGESAREAAAGITGPKVVRAMAPDFAAAIDPVSVFGPSDLVLGLATGAGLMAARTDARGRTTVAPELAAGPPAVSNGGRTYTFTVRRGARFSSGARVTAQAVRSSIERAVDPKQLNTYCHDLVLHDLAGEDAYESGRAGHIRGLRASGDRVTITLAGPDATLPARLANPCLSVVPPGTPVSPGGLEHPIPSAGPYAVASFVRFEQVVLRRNRFYDGPRKPALDALIVKGGMTGEAAAAAVQRGAADYMADTGMPPSGDLEPGSALARRYGRPGGRLRYLRPPSTATMMLIFDTRRGLFRSARLRRAVNLALDRRALAGFGHADPRSLLIPPGVPGHSTAGPYPLRPDLRRARALAAGHHGTVVVAADAGGPAGSADPVLEELRRDLARIGITAKVVLRANPVAASTDPRQHIDAVFTGWSPDYPDPFDAIDVVLDPAARPAGLPAFFDDARWLRRMRRAAATPQARRAAVYGRLDRALALGPAPVAVLGGPPGVPQLVSSRLGCLAFVFGRLDLSSVCVRK
jgi:peptide/nickel transport system substrate-binding protein